VARHCLENISKIYGIKVLTLQEEIQYYESFLANIKPSGLLEMLQEIIIISHADTYTHLHNTAHYVYLISRKLGFSKECSKTLACISSLHDIAKVTLPNTILDKPSSLTIEEYESVKEHTVLGHQILVQGDNHGCEVASQVALNHHEWFGRGGYPNGKAGHDIPLPATITSVADVFDALVGEREYKQAWDRDVAFDYIQTNKDLQFDPDVVDAFMSLKNKIIIR